MQAVHEYYSRQNRLPPPAVEFDSGKDVLKVGSLLSLLMRPKKMMSLLTLLCMTSASRRH